MLTVNNITLNLPKYLGSQILDGVAVRLKMPSYRQVCVAQSDPCKMFFESGLKGSLRFAHIQLSTTTAGDDIDHIAELAMK